MRIILTISAIASLVVTGCVVGIDPPPPTARVLVEGGIFPFGTETPCFDSNETVLGCGSGQLTGLPRTYPIVKVDLKSFLVDEHEVTNAQYRYCVEMGNCPAPQYGNTQNIDYYWDNPVYDNFPVVNVTRGAAQAYCEFMGGRLPTEVEWERVAGGKSDLENPKRVYPVEGLTWQRLADCDTEPYGVNISYCLNKGNPAEVKTSNKDYVLENGVKVYDLAGNVAEWVSTGWVDAVTCAASLPKACDCWNCQPADANCKEECYTKCDDCESNENCYVMCEDELAGLGLPVCIQYAGLVDAAAFDEKGTDGKPMARGGVFTIKADQTCQMSVAYRNRTVDGVDKSQPSIGFRCVADVNTVDNQ